MTRYRIPPEDYMDAAPSSPGEQARINHTNCPAGVDNRRRLYVKKSDSGNVVLAYCHNCGGSGIHHARTTPNSDPSALLCGSGNERCGTGTAQENGPAQRRDFCSDNGDKGGFGIESTDRQTRTAEWPVEARVWLRRYGLTGDYDDIFYSPEKGRVGLACMGVDGNYSRIIYRRIHSWDSGPKYMQDIRSGAAPRAVMQPSVPKNDGVVVITEDVLSAKKVTLAGYSAYPLLTTKLSPDDMIRLTDQYSRVIVWLDNDNPTVKIHRDQIVDNLSLLCTDVSVISDKADPKHYSIEQIEMEINNE